MIAQRFLSWFIVIKIRPQIQQNSASHDSHRNHSSQHNLANTFPELIYPLKTTKPTLSQRSHLVEDIKHTPAQCSKAAFDVRLHKDLEADELSLPGRDPHGLPNPNPDSPTSQSPSSNSHKGSVTSSTNRSSNVTTSSTSGPLQPENSATVTLPASQRSPKTNSNTSLTRNPAFLAQATFHHEAKQPCLGQNPLRIRSRYLAGARKVRRCHR